MPGTVNKCLAFFGFSYKCRESSLPVVIIFEIQLILDADVK